MTDTKFAASDVRPFDLYRAGDILHESSQVFNSMTRQSAKKFEAELANMLQDEIRVEGFSEIEKKHIDARSCKDYFKEWVLVNEKHNHFGVVSVDKKLFFALMELLCGGGREYSLEPVVKDFLTPPEQHFFDKIINTLFRKMEQVAAPLAQFHIAMVDSFLDRSEADHISLVQEEFISTNFFEVSVRGITGHIIMEFPKSLLKENLNIDRDQDEPEELLKKLKAALEKVDVPIEGKIPLRSMSLTSVLEIKEGDILPVPNMPRADVYIGGKYFIKGDLMSQDGYMSLELAE